MAQDFFASLVEAVKRAESGGRRYDKSGKLLEGPKTKYGTAKGEMQVLDAVMRRPGFGVKPAADESPEERSRVGQDLLKAFSKRYGNLEATLAAYNWGPGKTDKWLREGADPSRLPSETRKYIEKIRNTLTQTAVAGGKGDPLMSPRVATQTRPAAPRAIPRPRVLAKEESIIESSPVSAEARQVEGRDRFAAVSPAASSSISAQVTPDVLEKFGPNYQAALAAMTLADTRDDDVDEDSIVEQYLDDRGIKQQTEEQPKSAVIADMGLSYQSPFAEEEPVKLAEGGIVYRAEGSPIYGEIAMGGFTPDTRQALSTVQYPSAREMLATLRRVGSEGVSNVESLLRGSVAAIPGVVGDVESIFRDDKNRKFATSAEVEKQYLPKRVTRPTKEAEGFTEVGTNLPLPVQPGTVARGAKAAAKSLGPTAAQMLEKAGPQPFYAVKPKGGVFYPEGSGSVMDDYLDKLVQELPQHAGNIPGKQAKEVADFIRTAGRKYFTTSFGTSKDPLREAIAEGRMPLFGGDKETFRKYLLNAARADDPEAIIDLERAYDRAIPLQGSFIKRPTTVADYSMEEARKGETLGRLNELMAAEKVPEELRNISLEPLYQDNLSASYMADAQKTLGALLEGQRGPVSGAEKSIMFAAEKGEPIYDFSTKYPSFDVFSPRSVLQGIASIPVDELQRMSFPEALVRGAQNTRLQRSWDDVVDRVKAGKTVDKKFFEQGVKPVLPLEKAQWVQVTTPEAVRLEGAAMNHSVGDYAKVGSYGHGGLDAFKSGKAQVFSLRDEKGLPSVTVEAKFENGDYTVSQIKAPFNSAPTADDKPAIFQLLEQLKPKEVRSETYKRDRGGNFLDEPVSIDWGTEYDTFSKYRTKNVD